MNNGYVFSWAENAEGKMVHVDSVPNCLCSLSIVRQRKILECKYAFVQLFIDC